VQARHLADIQSGRWLRLGVRGVLLFALVGCDHETREPPPDPGDAMPEAGLDATLRPDIGGPRRDAAPAADDASVEPDANPGGGEPVYRLTIMHVGGGGGHLLATDDEPGLGELATALEGFRALYTPGPDRGVILLSTGDSLAPGPGLDLAFESGVPNFQGQALAALGVDVAAIGDRDLARGPVLFSQLVESAGQIPFVAANLSFLNEPALAAPLAEGRLVNSVVLDTGGDRVGIVGVTLPTLEQHGAPGGVSVLGGQDQVNEELDALRAQGINKLIVLAHMQDLDGLMTLASQLDDADLVVGSTGEAVLANPTTEILGGDVAAGPYPTRVRNNRGRTVRVVGVPDDFRYLGRVTVDFDIRGLIVATDADSGPFPVATAGPFQQRPDPTVLAEILDPARSATEALGAQPVGHAEVELDARRGLARSRETNLGDLTADAIRWVATVQASDAQRPPAAIGLLPAEVFSGDALLPPGPLTRADLWAWFAREPFVVLAPRVAPTMLKAMLEDGFASVDVADGRFLQLAGAQIVWDPEGAPRRLAPDGTVLEEGRRVRRVLLDDGTQMVEAGLVRVAEPVSVALTDTLALRHGLGGEFVHTGVPVGEALREWIVGALEGRVDALQYPQAGAGRIRVQAEDGQ
jgi:5'-nucleotidase / UDP-sugar diphosphatase